MYCSHVYVYGSLVLNIQMGVKIGRCRQIAELRANESQQCHGLQNRLSWFLDNPDMRKEIFGRTPQVQECSGSGWACTDKSTESIVNTMTLLSSFGGKGQGSIYIWWQQQKGVCCWPDWQVDGTLFLRHILFQVSLDKKKDVEEINGIFQLINGKFGERIDQGMNNPI